ncbi:hypothetical protein C2845_PM08G02080 [Panicum miliaceum]|uniref:Uncharacterized protein n=1 Tax=Panicum miliaceum TaxID=4540 RepID=A0A3L6R5M4_PANMI|nr:hypothetical protein C2845_PM08G02080 [Panicum miliaceum]
MGRWDTTQLVFGVASPGIRVGTCFYWLCRRHGHSAAARRWSATRRRRRTPRSARVAVPGRLRLCAFDIRDEESSNIFRNGRELQHNGVEGVHGVWVMDAAGAWWRVHEAGGTTCPRTASSLVDNLSAYCSDHHGITGRGNFTRMRRFLFLGFRSKG